MYKSKVIQRPSRLMKGRFMFDVWTNNKFVISHGKLKDAFAHVNRLKARRK